MKNIQTRFQIKENARLLLCKACRIALSHKPAVEEALRELGAEGVIKKVAITEWVAPMCQSLQQPGLNVDAFS